MIGKRFCDKKEQKEKEQHANETEELDRMQNGKKNTRKN